MTYQDHHKNLVALKAQLQADGLLKDSYINMLNALITTTRKQFDPSFTTTPVLDRLKKEIL